MDNQLHDEPSAVSAEAGQVFVDGPGGIIVALTPHAAEETMLRLQKAAIAAREQDTDPGECPSEPGTD